jgi:hypothetical protein
MIDENNHVSNEDLFDDIVSLCCKIVYNKENRDSIYIYDLIILRDSINELRKRVAQGQGYKSFPKLIKEHNNE